MDWYEQQIAKFRQLPTPLLVLLVLSRFIFGLGLGATLAGAYRRQNWKMIGGLIMALGTGLAIPGAIRILRAR